MRSNRKSDWAARVPAAAALLAAAALWGSSAHAQIEDCGTLENAFGPFDYNDPSAKATPRGGGESPLWLVEKAHFTPQVENLIAGASGTVLADLDYTLRAFPNHPRALYAMSKFYIANSTYGQKLGRYTMECWFERAMRFSPRDGVVPAVYGVYLAKKGEHERALASYKKAIELVPDFAEAHYNLGLLYLDLKRYDLANAEAQRAYELGFPLPGLRRRLQQLDAWKPVAAQPAADGATSQ